MNVTVYFYNQLTKRGNLKNWEKGLLYNMLFNDLAF